MNIKLFILLLILWKITLPQDIHIDKIEPPNWWVGMKLNHVQLMVYGSGLSKLDAKFENSRIKVTNIQESKNHSYVFIDIHIPADTEPDIHQLTLFKSGTQSHFDFPVLKRDENENIHQGFGPEDIIYLITPDRFANGDPDNDHVDGMRDKWDTRDKLGRHGGDIQGIIDRIEYLKDLGITAIWINPLIENDMDISYHGYGATDFYKIDPRFGSNELYKELVEKAHEMEIKIILDHVVNHIGYHHPWMENLPFEDWINGSMENHDVNTHKKTAINDIYADSTELLNIKNGWFVDEMPDLNQKNPFLANYIIQNTIWWIEYAGIDGIREDTYPYADAKFLSDWAAAIIKEYPDFNIVGEVWIHDPVFLSTYQTGSFYPKNFDSNLPSVTDYGLFEAIGRVFNRDQSIEEIYHFLSKDFLYPNPDNLMTFLDNHDVMRAIDLVHGNIQRFKMAFQLLLTTRGIPQIYYGSEIGLQGGDDHGFIRRNFPGGFPEDKRDAFKQEGRTVGEDSLWTFMKNLIDLRKNQKALSLGSLTHYPVFDEFYIYVRSFKDEKIIIIANNKAEDRKIELNQVNHILSGREALQNLQSGEKINLSDHDYLSIPGYDLGIFIIDQ
jgi:glycosidase